MLCPYCKHENLEGADQCESCLMDLQPLGLPEAETRARGPADERGRGEARRQAGDHGGPAHVDPRRGRDHGGERDRLRAGPRRRARGRDPERARPAPSRRAQAGVDREPAGVDRDDPRPAHPRLRGAARVRAQLHDAPRFPPPAADPRRRARRDHLPARLPRRSCSAPIPRSRNPKESNDDRFEPHPGDRR